MSIAPVIELPVRPVALCAIAITGIAAGALLGAVTNAINGAVSPLYFVNVLGWHGIEDVWRASIGQGIFEGGCFGFFFSLAFIVGVGVITRGACPLGFALRYILWIVAGTLVCWGIGGLSAMLLATISPEMYRRAFFGVPEQFGPMLAYAWVGGSIWGVEFGGFVCMVLGLVLLRANWLGRKCPSVSSTAGVKVGQEGPSSVVE